MEDRDIIENVEKILESNPECLGEDAGKIRAWLSLAREGNSETTRQTVNLILDILENYPEILAILCKENEIRESCDDVKGLKYDGPPPGDMSNINADEVVVCPELGCLEQDTLMRKGECLLCPVHNKKMIPKKLKSQG